VVARTGRAATPFRRLRLFMTSLLLASSGVKRLGDNSSEF
jgi:hypothetical protein